MALFAPEAKVQKVFAMFACPSSWKPSLVCVISSPVISSFEIAALLVKSTETYLTSIRASPCRILSVWEEYQTLEVRLALVLHGLRGEPERAREQSHRAVHGGQKHLLHLYNRLV